MGHVSHVLMFLGSSLELESAECKPTWNVCRNLHPTPIDGVELYIISCTNKDIAMFSCVYYADSFVVRIHFNL